MTEVTAIGGYPLSGMSVALKYNFPDVYKDLILNIPYILTYRSYSGKFLIALHSEMMVAFVAFIS